MSSGTFPYAQVAEHAAHLWRYLSLVCERVDVAGSVRRLAGQADAAQRTVGDLELVVLADLPPLMARLAHPAIRNLAGRDRKRRFELQMRAGVWLPVELNLARWSQPLGVAQPVCNYGWKWLLATGNAEWNHWFVTARHLGGLKPDGIALDDGFIHLGGIPQHTPDEAAVFQLWGLPFVPPTGRDAATVQRLRRPRAARRAPIALPA